MIPTAKAPLLEGKRGLIVGCAKAFRALGAELAITYLKDKARKLRAPMPKLTLEE